VRSAWAAISRADAARDAARGWKGAGAIDAATLSAIQAEYPDPRIALHRAWRALVFVLVSIAIGAMFFGVFVGDRHLLVPCLVFGAALAVATEVIRGSRLSGTGADAATACWAAGFLLATAAFFLTDNLHVESDDALTLGLWAAALLGALAAWHWGFWLFAASGTAALFFAVARQPFARTAWIVLSILAMAVTFRRFDRAAIAPAHRFGLAAAFATSAAALYAATNLYSFDMLAIERIRLSISRGARLSTDGASPVRLVAILATAAFPAVFLAWGIRARRTLLLAIGIVAAALSVATLRHYVPMGPRWAYLTVCGGVLVGAALWIHRRLRDAPGRTWRGLTADPLYSDAETGVSPLGALGAHLVAPAAPHEPDRGLSTGGGEFGGGGASGQY
jgi:MFS family permease